MENAYRPLRSMRESRRGRFHRRGTFVIVAEKRIIIFGIALRRTRTTFVIIAAENANVVFPKPCGIQPKRVMRSLMMMGEV